MIGKSSVRETYDGLIAEMRMKGYTLQRIADITGVTKERIRQILERHFPVVKYAEPSGYQERQVARMLGCSKGALAYWREKGMLNPRRFGGRWFYDDGEIEKARRILEDSKRQHMVSLVCVVCGKEFQIKRWDYRSRLGRRNRPKKTPFFFCSRHCLGKYAGTHYGFAVHPNNAGGKRKWDYEKVYSLWQEGWSMVRISKELGIPYISVVSIIHKCRGGLHERKGH